MGDSRRFHLFSNVIAEHFPTMDASIADVAGGKGYLQAALHQLGYNRVVSWDKRPRYASSRAGYRYGWFDYTTAPADYNLVVGMHPDEGTDHIIRYAVKHRVPFCICPCCVKPSAAIFNAPHKFRIWVDHLARLATDGDMDVEVTSMKMNGKNLVMIGRPA